MPRALHIVQSLAVENGGTSVSVPALAAATADTGRYRNTLLHFSPDGAKVVMPDSTLQLFQYPCRSFELMLPTTARGVLRTVISGADVVHIHGIWTGHSAATMQIAKQLGKPVVVSAHGMLDAWALRHKSWKKAPYSSLVERPGLLTAKCLRALTKVEAENYRSFGLSAPVAVIPNGIAAPEAVSPAEFREVYPHLKDRRILLFLGRLHKKKGVDLLVKAWNEVYTRFPDAHLVIAGPDDGALGTMVRDRDALLAKAITVCGMLTGSLKWSALAAAAAFTLPSFSEGLSMATLEALTQGLPVLITRECNFREIDHLDCTFLIQPSVDSIEEGLVRLLSCSAGELRSKGKAGAEFARRNYSWPAIGHKMADVYDWMLRGSIPPFG